MREGAVGKGPEAIEEVIQGFGGGLEPALGPEFGHVRRTELGSLGIQAFVEAVGGEQDNISGGELNDVLIVGCGGNEAGWQSALSERLALSGGSVERERDSCVGKGKSARGRVEDGIQRRAETAGQRTLQ